MKPVGEVARAKLGAIRIRLLLRPQRISLDRRDDIGLVALETRERQRHPDRPHLAGRAGY